MMFEVVGPNPTRKWTKLNRPTSTNRLITPTTPNAEISLSSTRQGVLNRSRKGTGRVDVGPPHPASRAPGRVTRSGHARSLARAGSLPSHHRRLRPDGG